MLWWNKTGRSLLQPQSDDFNVVMRLKVKLWGGWLEVSWVPGVWLWGIFNSAASRGHQQSDRLSLHLCTDLRGRKTRQIVSCMLHRPSNQTETINQKSHNRFYWVQSRNGYLNDFEKFFADSFILFGRKRTHIRWKILFTSSLLVFVTPLTFKFEHFSIVLHRYCLHLLSIWADVSLTNHC